MMRKMILLPLLMVSLVGVLKAQEAIGEKAEAVKKEILKLEDEKLKAFQSTGTSNNYCAEWVKNNDAEQIVHMNADATEDTKEGLIKDLQKGERKLLSIHYGPQTVRIYGNGGNGTTAVTTYSTFSDIDLYGKRSSSEHHAVDVWVKQGGKWWFVVHSVHPLPTPEAVQRQAEHTK